MALRVCDFFCGAGGLSEGFRQRGFSISFALDIWKPAIETHMLNHPDCENHVEIDIREINTPRKIDEIVPDAEVIVGSPPCVAFSYSNRGGNGRKDEGMELVKAFLRIVAWKKKRGKLKYWLMENVPPIQRYLKKSYTYKELGLPGGNKIALKINGENYNAFDYGAPQKRVRFICGEFPRPERSMERFTLGDVVNGLRANNGNVKDPIYGFTVPTEEITDYFYDSTIPRFKWKQAKRLKEDSNIYGKMVFPDRLDGPSRTVMALRTTSSRESIILPNGHLRSYRSPTIRELASVMTFPINYLFQAESEADKQKLVGNSVCPVLSAAIAGAILKKEMIRIPKFRKPNSDPLSLKGNLNGMRRKRLKIHDKKFNTRFNRHIDYLKYRGFRVEIDNKESNFSEKKVVWDTKLHYSTGKERMKYMTASLHQIESLLRSFHDKKLVRGYIGDVKRAFTGKIPDAKTFQNQYCSVRKDKRYFSPEKALKTIRRLVNKHFPKRKFKNVNLDILDGKYGFLLHGKPLKELRTPIQFIAGFYACKYVSDLTKK